MKIPNAPVRTTAFRKKVRLPTDLSKGQILGHDGWGFFAAARRAAARRPGRPPPRRAGGAPGGGRRPTGGRARPVVAAAHGRAPFSAPVAGGALSRRPLAAAFLPRAVAPALPAARAAARAADRRTWRSAPRSPRAALATRPPRPPAVPASAPRRCPEPPCRSRPRPRAGRDRSRSPRRPRDLHSGGRSRRARASSRRSPAIGTGPFHPCETN